MFVVLIVLLMRITCIRVSMIIAFNMCIMFVSLRLLCVVLIVFIMFILFIMFFCVYYVSYVNRFILF